MEKIFKHTQQLWDDYQIAFALKIRA